MTPNAYCAFCYKGVDWNAERLQACPDCGSLKFEVYIDD